MATELQFYRSSVLSAFSSFHICCGGVWFMNEEPGSHLHSCWFEWMFPTQKNISVLLKSLRNTQKKRHNDFSKKKSPSRELALLNPLVHQYPEEASPRHTLWWSSPHKPINVNPISICTGSEGRSRSLL